MLPATRIILLLGLFYTIQTATKAQPIFVPIVIDDTNYPLWLDAIKVESVVYTIDFASARILTAHSTNLLAAILSNTARKPFSIYTYYIFADLPLPDNLY